MIILSDNPLIPDAKQLITTELVQKSAAPNSSSEELTDKLSIYSKQDLIHVVQDLIRITLATEGDLPMRTKVNKQETALIPIAWSYYVEKYGFQKIKKHLNFIMKLNPSEEGERAKLVVEALQRNISILQDKVSK